MQNFIKDSSLINSLDSLTLEQIKELCPNKNYDNIFQFYETGKIYNPIKLANELSFFGCERLKDVLMYIKKSFLTGKGMNYNKLSIDMKNAIVNLDKFKQVECGENFTVALRYDGSIYSDVNPLPKTRDFIKIACTTTEAYGLTNKGIIWRWGYNSRYFRNHTETVCGTYKKLFKIHVFTK